MSRLAKALRVAEETRRRYRWLRLVAGARLTAIARRATLELNISPDARLGPDVRIEVADRARASLRIGAMCRVDGDVIFELRDGARVEIGSESQLRKGCRLVASAPLVMEGQTVLSWDCYVFSAYGITIGARNAISQNVTIVDSRHFFTEVPTRVWHNAEGRPVKIGADVWIGPNAVIGAGTTVGDHCVVAGNAVVTRSAEPDSLIAGVPGRPRPLGALDRRNPAP